MAREIRPISEIPRRMPEQGRIRIGKEVPTKSGRTRPTKLSTFRFTSSDQVALAQLAEQYGGAVTKWDSPQHPNQYEVETLCTELPIVLPPACLSGPIYEQWSAGGLQRRCDGVSVEISVQRGDDYETVEKPCICKVDGTEDCKVKVRLQVLLRDVRFAGAWLLTTGSWNAAQELPGMVDMILATQATGGLPLGILRLEERKRVRNGKTNVFVIPVLGVDASLTEIVGGGNQLTAARARSLGGADAPALGAPDPDNEVVEGVVEWEPAPIEALADQVTAHWNAAHPVATCTTVKLLGILASQISGVSNTPFRDIDSDQADRVADLLESILSGDVELTSIEHNRVGVRRLG